MPALAYVGSTAAAPSVVYAMFNGQNGDGVYAIGAATRTNGVWSEYGSNPVLTHGSGWESDHVKDPCLIWDGSRYVLYYSGYNGTYYQIGRATALSHNGPWTKYVSNPVVALGSGGSVDEHGCLFPTVLYEPSDTGNEWKMWYAAIDASGNSTIAYAHSSDGLSWTKAGKVLDVGGVGTWDHVGVAPGAIYKSGATYYLFYQGRMGTSPSKWQGGYATFSSPTGTYTKGGGNPTLLAGFNTSGNSQSLTANTNAGSAIVTVADTSHWAVGEPMVIAANNVVTEYHQILTIDSSTQVTLDSVAVSSFTTAHGAVLRPFYYVSIIPRSVLATGGGFEAGISAFQPVDDLTVTGETLWEGSMGATASSLTGSWTLTDADGLWFPLSPANSGWHKYSAENPSVIAAP